MKSRSGFSLVEGLLIVVIVSVIGFGGWYVWDNNPDEKSNQDKTASNNSEQTDQQDSEEENIPEGWVKYSGVGFSFVYPSDWDGLADLPDVWTTTDSAEGYQTGGGFGPILTYKTDSSKWYIKELGRYPDKEVVGDEFDLASSRSSSNVVVYNYTQGDGPFSSTTLLFVAYDKMVAIGLPDVCSGNECNEESTYNSEQINEFAQKITESITVE